MSYGGRRVVTTTYTSGGPGGGTRTVTTRSFNYGGGGGGDSSTITNHYPGNRGGSSFMKMPKLERPTQRPQVIGRSSRKEAKNPFSSYKSQKYEDIKAECLARGELFCDPEFPADDESIFFSRAPPRRFEWKRPGEICESIGAKPEFISSGASRFDVQQGELGDCWLLAAVASLTINHKLLDHVVPPEQTFDDQYCGIFKFNFWHQGEWEEIIVDDRLPTYYNQLVFMHSTDKNEFWSALLEKAYAKLVGSYEALKGGSTSEAMEDFTGGVTENVDLRKPPDNLFTIMVKAAQRGSIMGCSIDANPNQLEARLDNGLVMGHAYSVTAVKLIDIQTPRTSGKIPMVRVRNPWGNEAEWKGAWSDQSPEWQYIPKDQKDEMGLTFDDDGEFWMSFKDWQENFQKLEICNLGPDSLDEDEISAGGKRWEATTEAGEWIPRVNAGGCRNYLETFWTNPQYRMTLTDPDDDEDDLCTVLIGVLQKDRRKKRKEGLDMLTIGYVIYKLRDDNSGPLDMKFFKYNASVAKSPSFINLREICGRHKLSPGTYVIIPSTFEPHQKGEYIVRIFTEKANETSEMDEETGMVEQKEIPTEPVPDEEDTGRNMRGESKPTSRRHYKYSHNMTRTEVLDLLSRLMNEDIPPTDEDREQEDALKNNFRKLAGEDMEIDAHELKEILNKVFKQEFQFGGFSLDACRSMVAMHDGDLSGKLGFSEFKMLWDDLRKWKTVFKDKDVDQSGNLNTYELRQALNCSGFRLSNRTYSALVMRYGDRSGKVPFEDFILCAIRLKTMLTSYRMAQEGNLATFAVDDFIQTTMYA